MKKIRIGGLLLLGASSYCLASAPDVLPGSTSAQPLRGCLLARSEGHVTWTPVEAGGTSQSTWLHTEVGGEAVVALANNAHLRLAEGTTLHVQYVGKEAARLEVFSGKIFASLPTDGKSSLAVATPTALVKSVGGDFVMDVAAQDTRLSVLDGCANLAGTKLDLDGIGNLPGVQSVNVSPGLDANARQTPDASFLTKAEPPGEVAVDGPDVRVRKKDKRKFVEGEENQTRRVGEDETPSPSPSPQYTPPPTEPPPPPPNNPPLPQFTDGGGGEIWPYILGGVGLGTGLYFLLRDTDTNDSSNQPFFFNNNIPVSP